MRPTTRCSRREERDHGKANGRLREPGQASRRVERGGGGWTEDALPDEGAGHRRGQEHCEGGAARSGEDPEGERTAADGAHVRRGPAPAEGVGAWMRPTSRSLLATAWPSPSACRSTVASC